VNPADKTTTVELTDSELATLIDAVREHEQATIKSGLRGDHTLFADLASIRAKLDTAYEEHR
jgi:hypothetical protein